LMKSRKVLKLTELNLCRISLISVTSMLKLIGNKSSLKKSGNSLNGFKLAKNW